MVQTNYYNIPRISNSHLSQFKAELIGDQRKPPQAAFDFGAAFHQLLLEPQLGKKDLNPDLNYKLIAELVEKAKESNKIKWLLQWAWKEKTHLFTDPLTRLDCKLKSDLNYRNSTIVDVKTTSAWSQKKFIEDAHKYDYDRQAAFYLDGLKAKNFLFIAVQKRSPHNIYFLDTANMPGFIDYGRKKYTYLLQKWKTLQPLHLLPSHKPDLLVASTQ